MEASDKQKNKKGISTVKNHVFNNMYRIGWETYRVGLSQIHPFTTTICTNEQFLHFCFVTLTLKWRHHLLVSGATSILNKNFLRCSNFE